MPDCPNRNELLATLAASSANRVALRTHIEACDNCRERVARMIGVMRSAAQCEAFLSGAADEVPDETSNRVLASLQPFFDSAVVGRHHCPTKELILAMVIEDGAVTDDVSSHVQQCAHCQRDITDIKELQYVALAYDTFMSGENESLSAEVSQRIFDRVDAAYRREMGRPPSCPPRPELYRVLAGGYVKSAVRAHAHRCSACRQVLSSLRAITSLAAGAEAFDSEVEEEMPADVAQRIFDQLTESGAFPSASCQPAEPAPCPDTDTLLESLTARETPSSIRDHVAKCKHCRGRMAKLSSVFEVASQLEVCGTASTDGIPSDVADRLFSTLSQEHDKLVRVPHQGTSDVFPPSPQPAINNAVTGGTAFATTAVRGLRLLRGLVPYSSCACLLIAVGLCLPLASTTPRGVVDVPDSQETEDPETNTPRLVHDLLAAATKSLEELNKVLVSIGESDRQSEDNRSKLAEYSRLSDVDQVAAFEELENERSLPEEYRLVAAALAAVLKGDRVGATQLLNVAAKSGPNSPVCHVLQKAKDCVALVPDTSIRESEVDLGMTVKFVQEMVDWAWDVAVARHTEAVTELSDDKRLEYGKRMKFLLGNPPTWPVDTSRLSASAMASIDQPEHGAQDRGRTGAGASKHDGRYLSLLRTGSPT